ncbi:lipoprotein [Xenorhabdus innexi]|uniref:Lipoprotein n=1 Tax=Xenorhabdus innexi TaxID=290109 RepID=A0A1N6MX40_9GAMM|nr:lipoprotein [Xenorhabdus innexi]PHM30354.1 lipoprotein [Xenorhabdus innexi]SIP73435.1 Uncharacterized lipoprotein yceB [Xenorhabdus innexi]
MKKLLLGAALVLIGLLSGCGQFKDISINEGLLNEYLLKKVHYQKEIGISGIANFDITLGNLSSQIGRQDPEKIVLTSQAKVKIATIFGSTQADMALTIRAKPVFDAEQSAIFVKGLEIVDYQTTPEKAAIPVKALIPYLNTSLTEFFDTHPVYVLNPEKSKSEAAAVKFAKGLEIKPGKLVIGLTDK